MLEKLEFSIGGFFSGVKYARLWKEDGKYFKAFKGDFRDPENIYTEEMLKDEIDFLENKLAELKINGWKKEYRPEGYVVCDGTQWNLEYKEVGKNCRHIYGDNAYPDSWNEFIEAIGMAVPEMLNEAFDDEGDEDADGE